MIESLEARRLMSVTFDVESGVLGIQGTNGADVIMLRQRGGRIIVHDNGERTAWNASQVRHVIVGAGAGDDRIVLRTVEVRAHLFGHDGNDTLLGGRDDDLIVAGPGDDVLWGGAGDDTLNGGEGNDKLFGRAGNDTLYDYFGHNSIRGGPGADRAELANDPNVISSVELKTFLPGRHSVDPVVRLFATASAHGIVSVVVEATHFQGGYRRIFGDLQQTRRSFTVQVVGEDLAGPNSFRTQALETETRKYELGRLKEGRYTFTARSGEKTLAVLRLQVTRDGLSLSTPTRPGP